MRRRKLEWHHITAFALVRSDDQLKKHVVIKILDFVYKGTGKRRGDIWWFQSNILRFSLCCIWTDMKLSRYKRLTTVLENMWLIDKSQRYKSVYIKAFWEEKTKNTVFSLNMLTFEFWANFLWTRQLCCVLFSTAQTRRRLYASASATALHLSHSRECDTSQERISSILAEIFTWTEGWAEKTSGYKGQNFRKKHFSGYYWR